MKPTISLQSLISPTVMMIAGPLLLTVFLVVATFLAVRLGYFRLTAQFREVAAAEKNEQVLSEKEAVLREFAPKIGAMTDSAVKAIPEKNQSLLVMAHIRQLAQDAHSEVGELKGGGGARGAEAEKKLTTADMSFVVEGSFEQVAVFLQKLTQVSPVITIQDIKMTVRGGTTANAEVRIKNYWAKYPATIPSILTPLPGLTSEEETLIGKMGSLVPSSFPEILPSSPGERPNPFGF